MRARKPKRHQYHVTFDKARNLWVIKVGGALYDRGPVLTTLVASAASLLGLWATEAGQHSELIVHRKDGTIGKGPSSRRSYGGDPKGTSG